MQDFDSQAQAFRTLVEQELADGKLNFPTSLDASIRIKRLADDPDASLDDIARVVTTEPVLSARVVRMANSVAVNPYGATIDGVGGAVRRIGLSALRGVALAVAAEQLAHDQRSYNMRIVASGLWRHSVDVACWAHAIARQSRAVAPDAALLAGMMIDIGQFYLVSRASAFPAMENQIDRFAALVVSLDAPIGRAILDDFGLPEEIVGAYAHDDEYSGAWPPDNLGDLVFVAKAVSDAPNPFDNLLGRSRRSLDAFLPSSLSGELVRDAIASARASRQEMHAAICA